MRTVVFYFLWGKVWFAQKYASLRIDRATSVYINELIGGRLLVFFSSAIQWNQLIFCQVSLRQSLRWRFIYNLTKQSR